jgi:hypothetical protein
VSTCVLICFVLLLDGFPSLIYRGFFSNFEIWPNNVYDIILEMHWLKPINAWVACKHGLICGTKLDVTSFELTSMQALPKTP